MTMESNRKIEICLYIHAFLHICGSYGAIVSDFGNAVTDIRCAFPLMSWKPLGYIQCQKACIRLSDCEVLSYSAARLQCYLYGSGGCLDYSGVADDYVYLRRNAIPNDVGGNCRLLGCNNSNTCVVLKNSPPVCMPRIVPSIEVNYIKAVVRVDALYFWTFPVWVTYSGGDELCGMVPGRIAILDTDDKRHALNNMIQGVYGSGKSWLVGVSRDYKGKWTWSDGTSARIHFVNDDGNCAVLYGSGLHDTNCNAQKYVICEAI